MLANNKQGQILIIDDQVANLQVLEEMLGEQGYSVRAVTSATMALRTARHQPPDLFLLDVNMPQTDGYQLCEQLKADSVLAPIPVIFVSAFGEIIDKERAFQVGGIDYIVKPFHAEEVLMRVRSQVMLYRQQCELALRQEQDRLYLEQLSQTKDEIMHMTSHDLKNPLATIKLSAALMRRKNLIDGEAEIYLNRIEAQANYMQTLVGNLLDLAKLETGRALSKKAISIDELLDEAIAMFALQAEAKRITLTYDRCPAGVMIELDPDLMCQALNNLVSNAIKYTPKNGHVSISTSIEQNTLIITIADTGIGIPENDIPLIFEKFYRVQAHSHYDYEGTGLGLAIVARIVEQHGGVVEAYNNVHSGTSMVIRLPDAVVRLPQSKIID